MGWNQSDETDSHRAGYVNLGDLVRFHAELVTEAESLREKYRQVYPGSTEQHSSTRGEVQEYVLGQIAAEARFLDALTAFLMTWSADSSGALEPDRAAGERPSLVPGTRLRFATVVGKLAETPKFEDYMFGQLRLREPLHVPAVLGGGDDSIVDFHLTVLGIPEMRSRHPTLVVQCRGIDEQPPWVQVRAAERVEMIIVD